MVKMTFEKKCPLVLSKKTSFSPKIYQIKLSNNLPWVLGFVSRNSLLASMIQAFSFIIGFIAMLCSLAGLLTYGITVDFIPTYIISLALPLSVIFSCAIKKKLSVQVDVFVIDWLNNYLMENSIYFAEGNSFTSEFDASRTGFLGFQANKIVEVGMGIMALKATNGLSIKVNIVSDFDNQITLTAMDKEDLVLLLRDRKDLLLEFFPDDDKINAANECS
jgi:hypothetical protein